METSHSSEYEGVSTLQLHETAMDGASWWVGREADIIPNEELKILKKPDGNLWVLGQGSYGQVCKSCSKTIL